jgi:predicted DNA-binding transcriptional regulator YafY
VTTDRAIWILHGGPAGKRRRWRHVTPVRVWHGRIPHRAGEQWFLDAFDHESKTPRSFALLDIHRVRSEAPP